MATPFFSDDFNAADGVLLETYSASWVRSTSTPNGAIDVSGSAARQQTANTSLYANSASLAPSADYDVSANLIVVSGGGTPSVGVCGRMAGTGSAPVTFYQARLVNNSTGLVLARFINGATITLLSMPLNYSAGASPKITLRMQGDQISVLLDDVLALGPVTDSSITGPGYSGMRMASANTSQIRIDNLRSAPIDVAQPVQGAISWTEGSEAQALTANVAVTASASWLESNEATSISGRVDVIANASWTEASDVNSASIMVGAGVSAAIGWVEASEESSVLAQVSVRAAVAWVENNENVAIAIQLTVAPAEDIDALLVPPRQTVVFEGSRRVVAFEGGKRVVSFEGSKRLVEFQ
jgi:hypothetical protein